MTNIPRAEDVRTTSGLANYRFSDGQIVKGREEDGTLEVAEFGLLGRLLRVGIHRGTLDDGREYGKLEAELETADGRVSVGANINSLMASITFGEGLLAVGKGELVKFTAGRSKVKNRYGKFTTYANVHKINEESLRPTPARVKVLDRDQRLEDVLGWIEIRLQDHPAWAERPKRDSEDEDASTLDLFRAEIELKGLWPMLDDDSYPGYLTLAEMTYKVIYKRDTTYNAMEDVSEPVLAKMREGHDRSESVPAALQPFVKASTQADLFDPFA